MDRDSIELKLLAGKLIDIDGGLYRTPKIKDIVDIGEKKYNQYLSVLLFDKKNIDGDDLEDVDSFDLLCAYCYHDESFRETFFSALKFMFNEIPQMSHDDESVFFYFGDILDNWTLNKSNFLKFQELVRISNNISATKEEDYNPANERARKFIEKIKRNKSNKPKTKETINLASIIDGLSWRSNGISILDIFELTIFQLYRAFFTTEKIDNYQFTLQGVYAGTVDGKKINYQNIHWAKINELKT